MRLGARPLLDSIRGRAAEVLERFRGPGAPRPRAAVVTGQQVGLFTGPLLTLVKAEAAVQLSRDLESEGAPAEPCFWCASEDHDLVEVTRVLVPGPDGPRDLGPAPEALAANRKPVGALVPEVDFQGLVDLAIGSEQDTAFSDEARAFGALGEGKNFLDGFIASLSWLLKDQGLCFLDAASHAEKPALVPLALRLIGERAEVRRLLAERAAVLGSEGRKLQVKSETDALPLFALVEGERLLVREKEGRFSLKGEEGTTYSEEEVVSHLESGRWLPSFSALTRPLAASTLHPVAATILGPAEIAYWDQMLPLFGWAGLVPPVIVPRPTAVPVDRRARRMLERTGLTVADLLEGPEAVRRRRGAERGQRLLEKLDEAALSSAGGLESLRADLLSLDQALGKALDATLGNVRFATGRLRERVIGAASRADEAFDRDLDRLAQSFVPGGTLAERVYSPLVYIARHGRDALVGGLMNQLRWDRPGPQVIEL